MTAKPSGAGAPSGSRVATVRLSSLSDSSCRLDAKYYQEAFTLAKARVAGSGLPTHEIRKLAKVFVPGRMALVTSPRKEAGAPYLRAHDAFDTMPDSDRYMVAARTQNYQSYLLQERMILTPSSGRNLGPLAYVGKYLSQFAMTDIMRIVPKGRKVGLYLLTYLMTPTGHSLIRRGRTGTTVDHLSPRDVLSIPVVWPEQAERDRFIGPTRTVQQLLDTARRTLRAAEEKFHEYAGLRFEDLKPGYYSSQEAKAFTFHASRLNLRLDAAYYQPTALAARLAVEAAGSYRLDEVCQLRQLGRYKRYYVEKGHGRPILSGSQLTQLHPVNLQYISDRSFRDPQSFVLKKGWSIFTCDGRSEEALAATAYVSSLWGGWMASNHVMRAIPRKGYRPGYLYLALRSPFVQIQLKSRATGNVVDALDVPTVADVLLPSLQPEQREELGKAVEKAWERVAKALRLEERTVNELERFIVDSYEANRSSRLPRRT